MFGIVKTKEQKAEAEVERRRGDPKTYTEPLDYSSDPQMKDFLMDFYKNVLFKKQDEMKALLEQHPNTIGKYYKELVPSQMENEDFWQRYYYRVKTVDQILAEEAPDATKQSHLAEPPSPTKQGFSRDRTESTVDLLHRAEMRRKAMPMQEESLQESLQEGPDVFLDASETHEESAAINLNDKPAAKGHKSGDDDSSDEGSLKSGRSMKSTKSTKSARSARTRSDKPLSGARQERMQLRKQRSKRRVQELKKRRDADSGIKPSNSNSSFGSEGSRARRTGQVMGSLHQSYSEGLAKVQAEANSSWDKQRGSENDLKTMREQAIEQLLVGFPQRSPNVVILAPKKQPKENKPESFFSRIAQVYDSSKDPENLTQEEKNMALGIGKVEDDTTARTASTTGSTSKRNVGWMHPMYDKYNDNGRGRNNVSPFEEDEEHCCWDICFYILLTLTLLLFALIIFLIVRPDYAVSMGDGMCSPVAPYQTLTTNRGKIGIAPWWVWPPTSKGFMFDVMCGDERIRAMLVWAPKHRHEKEFRLVIGDINAEETVLRLNRLDKVKINPSEIEIHQSKEALEDEETELPEVIIATWKKGWDDYDEEIAGVR